MGVCGQGQDPVYAMQEETKDTELREQGDPEESEKGLRSEVDSMCRKGEGKGWTET